MGERRIESKYIALLVERRITQELCTSGFHFDYKTVLQGNDDNLDVIGFLTWSSYQGNSLSQTEDKDKLLYIQFSVELKRRMCVCSNGWIERGC
jgi:hypothetical protein